VDTDPNTVATSVHGAIVTAGSLNSVMDSTSTLSRIRVSLGTDGGADLVADTAWSDAGGATGSMLPPNCAVLVHKRTARGGRRGRGRFFLPWAIIETAVDEVGIITPANVTTIQTAMNTFRSTLISNSIPMVLLHDPGKTATGPPDPVTSMTVDRLISTQRRRLGR
jgi:hypothetical protein